MGNRREIAARGAVRGALAGVLAMGVAGVASAAPDWSKGLESIEKCGGVAKAGKNDCGTANHSCGGKASSDDLPDEWVYTPVGLCGKIGGKVLETKKL